MKLNKLRVFKQYSDQLLKKLKSKQITAEEYKEKISFAQIQLRD